MIAVKTGKYIARARLDLFVSAVENQHGCNSSCADYMSIGGAKRQRNLSAYASLPFGAPAIAQVGLLARAWAPARRPPPNHVVINGALAQFHSQSERRKR